MMNDDDTLSPVLFFNLALEKVKRSMPLHQDMEICPKTHFLSTQMIFLYRIRNKN